MFSVCVQLHFSISFLSRLCSCKSYVAYAVCKCMFVLVFNAVYTITPLLDDVSFISRKLLVSLSFCFS